MVSAPRLTEHHLISMKYKMHKGDSKMISIKGPGLKIFAAILAIIALGTGIWMTFFQSAGFEKTTATIVSIEKDPDYIPDPDVTNDEKRIVTVEYTVDGKKYTTALDSDSPSYNVGGSVEVMYDPENPSTIHSGMGFGIYAMAIGGAILLIIVVVTIRQKTSLRQLKEKQGSISYAPSEKGDERELYFLTDLGTPKYGHRIEDKNRKVLYEAKMTKFDLAGPFCFDFIDHEHNKTTPHLIGHQEDTEWNMILIDNHHTFTIDGEDIWKHLKENGITVESRFASGKVLTSSYTISRDGEQIAYVETTSQYVHEDDAEKHKVANKIPVQGFYRIRTTEQYLDLLFVTILAFARSGATDDKGGDRGILFGSMK